MIEQLPFGNTGHRSSRIVLGAAALGGMRQDRADQLISEAVAAGVNHIDTAASYGESELRLAPWLATNRESVFLASKTGERSGDGARAQLEASLTRLGVDQLDLIQLHNLVEEDEWHTAFSPGGAVDALIAARAEGLVRFIGVTGHGLRIASMHRRSLNEFEFDSVLLPLNHSLWSIDQYRADFEELHAMCTDRSVAMLTIKSIARRRWDETTQPRFSWYEPLSDPDAISRAVGFVLSFPGVFLATSSDGRQFQHIVAAAQSADLTRDDDALKADEAAFAISAVVGRHRGAQLSASKGLRFIEPVPGLKNRRPAADSSM
ncbi:MAG: aldo/keto reductase [Acidimicrobiales bacterium]